MSDANNYVTREEYNKDIKRIDIKNEQQDTSISTLKEENAELKVVWRILSDVPTSLDRIREEQIKISATFLSLTDKIEQISRENKSVKSEIQKSRTYVDKEVNAIYDTMNSKESRIDEDIRSVSKNQDKEFEKFKVNVPEFITQNWWKILILLVGGYLSNDIVSWLMGVF